MIVPALIALALTGPVPFGAGVFQRWSPGTRAVTYDTAVVPAGATATLTVTPARSGVRVRLTVGGLTPGRPYGAHLHVNPCTANPADAGPHYQHRRDPVSPSTDPRYANPRNEVWLDFTADARGAATVTSRQRRHFAPGRAPRSLVLHAERTHTGHGEAGTAGARVACLTLDGYGSHPRPTQP